MTTVNGADFLKGLEQLTKRVELGTLDGLGDVGKYAQAKIRSNIVPGTPGNSTNAPGDLQASVIILPIIMGQNVFSIAVGPTMNYALQRNYGGAIFPKVAPRLAFYRFGEYWSPMAVNQKGQNYMAKATTAVLANANQVFMKPLRIMML